MKKVCSQNPPFRILKDPIIYFNPFLTSGSSRHTCPINILTSKHVCRDNSNSQPNYSHSRLRIYVPENIASNFYTVCNIVLFPLSPFCEYLREIVFKVKNANFNAFENSHNICTTVHTRHLAPQPSPTSIHLFRVVNQQSFSSQLAAELS